MITWEGKLLSSQTALCHAFLVLVGLLSKLLQIFSPKLALNLDTQYAGTLIP